VSRDRAQAIELILERIRSTADQDVTGFPHYADAVTGAWTRTPGGDWTGGFWNGLLWLGAACSGEERLRDLARVWSRRLLPRLGSDTIFRGFLFWYGAGIGALLLGETEAAEIASKGARSLVEMYNPAIAALPLGGAAEESGDVSAWDVNIDGVPGVVPLLAWSGGRLDDSSLLDRALDQARSHVDFCVRPDGSVCQSARFDPATGALVTRYTHKGVTDASTWTRAQAWAMLGYAQASIWLSDEFLPVATNVADWWVEHLPPDGVAWWDFDAPNTLQDTSGSAIGAAALLKLASLRPKHAARYRASAEATVSALIDQHLTPTGGKDRRPVGMLVDGCYNNRIGLATSSELVWGDYFLLEALLELEGVLETNRL
jgi:unsaturated chondroitin disaccharide hydrolase